MKTQRIILVTLEYTFDKLEDFVILTRVLAAMQTIFTVNIRF